MLQATARFASISQTAKPPSDSMRNSAVYQWPRSPRFRKSLIRPQRTTEPSLTQIAWWTVGLRASRARCLQRDRALANMLDALGGADAGRVLFQRWSRVGWCPACPRLNSPVQRVSQMTAIRAFDPTDRSRCLPVVDIGPMVATRNGNLRLELTADCAFFEVPLARASPCMRPPGHRLWLLSRSCNPAGPSRIVLSPVRYRGRARSRTVAMGVLVYSGRYLPTDLDARNWPRKLNKS